MKKSYIIGLIALAVGIIIMASIPQEISSYASFKDAKMGKRVKIVGNLAKDREMIYDPQINANLFTFYMRDNDGKEQKIQYIGAKPQDFEMSESIVITGKMHEDAFVADELLLKCPSKYKGEEEFIKAQSNG